MSASDAIVWLGSENHAPTARNSLSDTYFVALAPFSAKPFRPGQSVGVGFTESGGSNSLTLDELLASPGWREHFELAGCAWAVAVIEALAGQPEQLMEALVARASSEIAC